MLQQYPELSDEPNIADDRIYFAGQLAILLADDGRLSEALPRLQPALAELRDTDHPHRHILANFYGQALAGLGRTPEALSVLSEADALDPEQNPGWAANNRMLQINILARHAGPASVVADTLVEAAQQAWQQCQETGMVNLVPIVRNLYTEVLLLLAPACNDPAGRLAEAEDLAKANLAYAEQIQESRSKIVALSLSSRIAHAMADTVTAEQHAQQAVQVLDEHDGRLPALRGDEIDHHAARVLAAAGHLDDAAALDDRAQQECERRLELIHPAHQSGFRALKTNRMILEG